MSDAELLLDPKNKTTVSRVITGVLETQYRDRQIMSVYSKLVDFLNNTGSKTNSEFVGIIRKTIRCAKEEVERLISDSLDTEQTVSVTPEIAGIVEECWRYWEQVKGDCGDDINLENQEFNVGLISSWVRSSHALSCEATKFRVYNNNDADLIFDEAAIAYLLAAQDTPTIKNEDGTYACMSGISAAMTELAKVLLAVCRVRIIGMNNAFQDTERNMRRTENDLRARVYDLEEENNRLRKRLEKHEPKTTM